MKGQSALPRAAFLVGLLIVGAGAVSSVWGRQLLTRISFFDARRIEVVGTRLVAPDSVMIMAAIGRARSVWEDFTPEERRLSIHPLIEEARVLRSGLHSLRIVVREVEPLAFVGIPELRPVRGDGTVLPIDPSSVSLDLPVLTTPAELEENSVRLRDGPARQALQIFAKLRALDPGLAAIVSDFELAEPEGLTANLDPSQPARRVTLPRAIDEMLVRRLRATLADLRSRRVDAAVLEARYADQVVVKIGRIQSRGGNRL